MSRCRAIFLETILWFCFLGGHLALWHNLTEEHEVKEIVEDFLEMIKEKDQLNNKILEDNEKTKLMSLSGVKKYPMRVKCATLSWHTLTSAIDNTQEEINSGGCNQCSKSKS